MGGEPHRLHGGGCAVRAPVVGNDDLPGVRDEPIEDWTEPLEVNGQGPGLVVGRDHDAELDALHSILVDGSPGPLPHKRPGSISRHPISAQHSADLAGGPRAIRAILPSPMGRRTSRTWAFLAVGGALLPFTPAVLGLRTLSAGGTDRLYAPFRTLVVEALRKCRPTWGTAHMLLTVVLGQEVADDASTRLVPARDSPVDSGGAWA